MIHNFRKSLKHEREQSAIADKFYRDVLNVTEIKRFNADSEDDMNMQRQDVDVLLTVKGTTYRVSEKFRDKDFGDLYIEVYSKYPHVEGWLHTGTPHAILYFTPKNVYWITHKSLKAFCLDKLFPKIQTEWFDELFVSGKTIVKKTIGTEKSIFSINLIQAHNKDGKEWKTMGVSVSFDILEKADVKFKRFPIFN
ncbi:MAG: hypothetical protein Q7U47_02905 [Paludibacter sp.]|nr:hypothetical protein [Paludibacter sp.]